MPVENVDCDRWSEYDLECGILLTHLCRLLISA